MPRLFVSYSDQDKAEVSCLCRELSCRGLRTWKDSDDMPAGRPGESEIVKAIDASSGMLVYLTPAAIDRPRVIRELRRGLAMASRPSEFRLIPIYCGQTPAEADLALHPKKVFGLKEQGWGHVKDEGPRALAEAAAEVLKGYGDHIIKQRSDDSPITVGLYTYKGLPDHDDSLFQIDLTSYYENGKIPRLEDWDRVILPAWNQLQALLAAKCPDKHLFLKGGARLSAMTAFGWVFNCTAGWTIDVDQRGAVWSTSREPDAPEPDLNSFEQPGDPESAHAIVGLSVSGDVESLVDDYRGQPEALPPRVTLHLKVPQPSGNSVADGGHGYRLAQKAMDHIRSLRGISRYPEVKIIHLFMDAPKSVALFCGYLANACGPLVIYERLRQPEETYVPGCRLST